MQALQLAGVPSGSVALADAWPFRNHRDGSLVVLRMLWQFTAGSRLRPWRSPYLRWRIETYWGLHADNITFPQFWRFVWTRRRELWRYLRWAEAMRKRIHGRRAVTIAAPWQAWVDTEPRA